MKFKTKLTISHIFYFYGGCLFTICPEYENIVKSMKRTIFSYSLSKYTTIFHIVIRLMYFIDFKEFPKIGQSYKIISY